MILAIIDHFNHQLFIENADDNEIQTKYKGEEEAYIRDKYGFKDNEPFSWDFISQQIEVFGGKNSNVMMHFN